jgi:uncharacterized protein (UPF0261 family)
MIDVAGQAFHDPAADEALFSTLQEHLESHVTVREDEADINDPAFATAMADELHRLYTEWQAR